VITCLHEAVYLADLLEIEDIIVEKRTEGSFLH
jgi:hypothetical protein